MKKPGAGYFRRSVLSKTLQRRREYPAPGVATGQTGATPALGLALPHLRDLRHRLPDLLLRISIIRQLAAEIGVIGAHVEMAVAAEVEQDNLLLAGLLAL